MLKFKREDVGLYFALGLIGGGVGLLIGAFIANRVEQKLRGDLAYLDEDMEAPDIHMETLPEDEDGSMINPSVKMEYRELKAVVKEIDALDMPERVVPKAGKMSKGRTFRLSRKDERELTRLLKEYKPTEVQIDLVHQGIMTVEELELELIEREMEAMEDVDYEEIDAEEEEEELELVSGEEDGIDHIDYSKPYRVFEDDKPDMDDLLPVNDIGRRDLSELLVTIGGRYEIMLERPEGKHQKNRKLLMFDEQDERVYQPARSGSGQPVPVDIAVMISPEVKDTIWDFLLFEDVDPIYIDDLKGTRWYEIQRDGTEEDGSDSDE